MQCALHLIQRESRHRRHFWPFHRDSRPRKARRFHSCLDLVISVPYLVGTCGRQTPPSAELKLALSAHAWNPAECPQDCVFPEDFWAQHRPGGNPVYYWPNNSDQNKFPCGPKWVDVLASTSTDLWTLLAQEYIAARLNILSFSCIQYVSLSQNLTNALYDAQILLNGSTCVVSDQAQAWSAIAVLQDFNNGNGKVHTCLCPQSTQCPSCTQCPTCTPSPTEGCTSLVIQTCCQTPTPSSTPPPPLLHPRPPRRPVAHARARRVTSRRTPRCGRDRTSSPPSRAPPPIRSSC